jgi:uncharacterized protein (TIGR00730 family)
MQRLCVFCGSSRGNAPQYIEAARSLGRLLAARRVGLVYGGSNAGLMGALADSVLEGGGHVTGVIPRGLVEREVAHRGLNDLRVVETMHERKALMADLADAFAALPGGFGTYDELCEIVTWAQIGIHRKPIGLLNTLGYWDPFLSLVSHAVEAGFVRDSHRDLLIVMDQVDILVDHLFSASAGRAKVEPKWTDPGIR